MSKHPLRVSIRCYLGLLTAGSGRPFPCLDAAYDMGHAMRQRGVDGVLGDVPPSSWMLRGNSESTSSWASYGLLWGACRRYELDLLSASHRGQPEQKACVA